MVDDFVAFILRRGGSVNCDTPTMTEHLTMFIIRRRVTQVEFPGKINLYCLVPPGHCK